LNLGIANEGRGDVDGARRVYQDLLDRIARREQTETLIVHERLIKAQAMARVGRVEPAVELTQQILNEGERDAPSVYQAAVIFAVCGEQNNALIQAKEARRLGLSSRWFGLPGFESLRGLPAFREMVRAD